MGYYLHPNMENEVHAEFEFFSPKFKIMLPQLGSFALAQLPRWQLARVQSPVVQSTIKLIQDYREYRFQFCNFSVRFSVHILSLCPSVLTTNLKLYKTSAVKNTYTKDIFTG